jgi:hypothetical protein
MTPTKPTKWGATSPWGNLAKAYGLDGRLAFALADEMIHGRRITAEQAQGLNRALGGRTDEFHEHATAIADWFKAGAPL